MKRQIVAIAVLALTGCAHHQPRGGVSPTPPRPAVKTTTSPSPVRLKPTEDREQDDQIEASSRPSDVGPAAIAENNGEVPVDDDEAFCQGGSDDPMFQLAKLVQRSSILRIREALETDPPEYNRAEQFIDRLSSGDPIKAKWMLVWHYMRLRHLPGEITRVWEEACAHATCPGAVAALSGARQYLRRQGHEAPACPAHR